MTAFLYYLILFNYADALLLIRYKQILMFTKRRLVIAFSVCFSIVVLCYTGRQARSAIVHIWLKENAPLIKAEHLHPQS